METTHLNFNNQKNASENVGDGLYAAIVYNCAVTNNAGRGMNDCTAYNCLVANNKGTNIGGGMEMEFNNGTTNWSGAAYNCVITNNTARYGGGVSGGAAFNCLIADNISTDIGGGAADTLAINCTIVGNMAANSGGGAYKSELYAAMADHNCIVFNNSASQFPNFQTIAPATNCCTPDASGTVSGWVVDDPQFVDAPNGDYRLKPGSPCINWGSNAEVGTTVDLDGNLRIVEDHVDIGCYEYQGILGLSDSDGDGLLDEWEHLWFGGNVLPEGNADGDMQSNGDEYVAGTDPTSSASYFHVTTDTTTTGNPSQHIIINWESETGRVYNVYWTPSLMQPFQPLEIGIQYPQNSYTDMVHSAESCGYYRVVVMRADYDLDGDGLPNDWEARYAVSDAYAHGDNDGFNNLEEFIAGTDPTNGMSYFTAASSVAEMNGTNYFVVEWISIPDRLYSVQWSTNLVSGFQALESGIEYPHNSYTDTVHGTDSEGFFKVDVRMK